MQVTKMYKIPSKQLTFEDFDQPVGMKLDPKNRWVKKAEIIPWTEIESEYAKLFKGIKGHVAISARMALGALLIQTEYGYSDQETVEQIQENPYLQFFCGLPGYKYERPFDASVMVRFRKRLSADKLAQINEHIIRKAEASKKEKDDDDRKNQPPKNHGTMIVDATCAPSQIKYPRDTELLNEAREKLEQMVAGLHDSANGRKPRMYQKIARKQYLSIARSKRNSAKKIRKANRQQLQYIRRDLGIVRMLLEKGGKLSKSQDAQLQVIENLYEQQKYMYENHVHSVKDRIVNLRQPYLRPIVRGKAKAPVEFGAKLDISVVNGMVRLEKQSFDAYNESELLEREIENYEQRYGCYPERVLADKIYRNRKNLSYCKEHGIRLSGPALGRPKKGVAVDKKAEYEDICERVEVERAFSLGKRKFSLGQIRTYLQETTQTVIALSILALNLSRVLRASILKMVHNLWHVLFGSLKWSYQKKLAFEQ